MSINSNFEKLVFEQIDKIPYGETRSYKEIAIAIGKPNSYRAVANACGKNPIPIVRPRSLANQSVEDTSLVVVA